MTMMFQRTGKSMPCTWAGLTFQGETSMRRYLPPFRVLKVASTLLLEVWVCLKGSGK